MAILDPLAKSANSVQLEHVIKITQSVNIFFVIFNLSLIIACFTANYHPNIRVARILCYLSVAITHARWANKFIF